MANEPQSITTYHDDGSVHNDSCPCGHFPPPADPDPIEDDDDMAEWSDDYRAIQAAPCLEEK
jgi:hypothetical protein